VPDQYRVIILPAAADDIVSICSFIERDSSQNAAAVAQQILDAIDGLEILPHRFRVHESRADPAKAVRSMPVPPFIVYYRVDDGRNVVRILSVRHGSRRQPRRFK
jgi:plasmid stabilization system protein ParE